MRTVAPILLFLLILAGCAPVQLNQTDRAGLAQTRAAAPEPSVRQDQDTQNTMDSAPQVAPLGLSDSCPPGAQPVFAYGFAALSAQLGARMGDPASCERTSAENGDSLQLTTRGLARYSKLTNVPSFTSGSEHWALTQRGLVYWVGRSTEAPADAQIAGLTAAVLSTAPTATPLPAQVDTQPPAPSAYAAMGWLQRPLELLSAYDLRHGTLFSKAIEQTTLTLVASDEFWAAFVPSRRALLLNTELQAETAQAVATVLAHEAMHVVDTAKYGGARSEIACYTYETSAFRLQAAVWQSFYGDPGKQDPGSELEEELNEILTLARTDSWRFVNDIKGRYQDQCE